MMSCRGSRCLLTNHEWFGTAGADIQSSFTDDDIEIPYLNIMGTLLLILIPCALGVWLRRVSLVWAKRAETTGGVVGALFLVAALIFGVIENADLFSQVGLNNSGVIDWSWAG